MTKLGGNYHQKKHDIVDTVMKLFLQHGNGLDLQIKINFLNINFSLINSYDGKCHARKDFYIDLQSGDIDTCKRIAAGQMQGALKHCGIEFESFDAWDRSIKL